MNSLPQAIGHNISDTLDSTIYDTLAGSNTIASLDASSMYTHQVRMPEPNSLKFDIDGESVEFSGKELVRLREMLSSWIEQEHPEDLL